jgi:hypothetical protein
LNHVIDKEGAIMSVDENEFFRQVTRLICGSLDIEKALNRCHQYIGKFMPVFRMFFVEVWNLI